ncbi:MAG: glutathione S-transferase family protein [Ahrensia sp.]|nr:glutathione S-transferase family protein [Ahrensia sp.]
MQLYHHPMVANARFIRLIIGEYDVDVDLILENTWERRPEFLALNPAGTLPVLIGEAGTPIVSSFAISEYLDETRGAMMRDRRLMPDYPLDRAEARRLIDWFVVKMDNDVTRPLVRERVFKIEMSQAQGGGAPDSAAMRAARANIKQHLRYLNWLAGSRNWLGGKTITMADMAAAASVSVLDYLGEINWAEVPQARDWYTRMKSRPSFRPLLTDRVRALTPVSHYADLDF